ncbi:MAG: tetratricopeptide repeat protein [Bacteroidota bacterium]
MKQLSIIMFLLFNELITSGQKMPSDYFEEGVNYWENENIDEALASFKYIVAYHPRNELFPRAFYNIGIIYFREKQYDSATTIFKTILINNFNETEARGGDIMSDPYMNYKYWSANLLHQIYYDKQMYDSSLYYLSLSDTAYPYLHFCGNEYSSYTVQLAKNYSDLYEKLGDLSSARKALLKEIFITEPYNIVIIDALKYLYQKETSTEKAIVELDKSLKNIYSKKERRENNEYISYYFRFQGSEIKIPDHFYYYDDHFNKTEVIKKIKDTDFYKMIRDL